MSVKIQKRCWALDISPTHKYVLIALAFFADDDAQCFPKISTIAKYTNLSRRAVAGALASLKASGILVCDSGKDSGTYNRYTIAAPSLSEDCSTEGMHVVHTPMHQMHTPVHVVHTGYARGAHPPIVKGTVHLTTKEQSRKDTRERDAPAPQSQQPQKQRRKRADAAPAERPDDVTEQTWEEWKAHRRRKKASITVGVVSRAREESMKAGMTLEAFFKEWVFRGSIGLKAEWIKGNNSGQKNNDDRTWREKEDDYALMQDAKSMPSLYGMKWEERKRTLAARGIIVHEYIEDGAPKGDVIDVVAKQTGLLPF